MKCNADAPRGGGVAGRDVKSWFVWSLSRKGVLANEQYRRVKFWYDHIVSSGSRNPAMKLTCDLDAILASYRIGLTGC